MRILCIGDVVSSIGREFLMQVLPKIKQDKEIDIVITNGENSAIGNGISPNSANFILSAGVDVITTGNHVFRRKEMLEFITQNPQVIRPFNWGEFAPGNGYYIIDKGSYQVAVVNLIGSVYMENSDNVFTSLDAVLKKIDQKIIIVDFHAEATAEKRALGFYADGRVSALFGTHTHVQTADEEILPNGTGYITDIGMTGPIHSVLGIKPEIIIEKFKTRMPQKFENSDGKCKLNGVIFTIDKKTGKTTAVERVNIIEE